MGQAGLQAECQIRVHTQMPLAHPTQLHNQSHLAATTTTFESADNNVETPRGEPILDLCTAHDDTGKAITDGQCNRCHCASVARHMHPARVHVAYNDQREQKERRRAPPAKLAMLLPRR